MDLQYLYILQYLKCQNQYSENCKYLLNTGVQQINIASSRKYATPLGMNPHTMWDACERK